MSGKKRSTFNLKFKLDAIEFAEKKIKHGVNKRSKLK